jgi:hypothetical protein
MDVESELDVEGDEESVS